MSRHIVVFSKEGYIKYTSHLDINRLFRRSIRKQGIQLDYSQGFNPHPKMAFAQPLSLGYSASQEYLEIETKENYNNWFIKDKLSEVMAEGIKIIDCISMPDGVKSLAASTDSAEYLVEFHYDIDENLLKDLFQQYLNQESIIALKKSKKKKELVEVEIRNKIRNGKIELVNNNYIMSLVLDSGSNSNLSPELVISTFIEFANLKIDRSEIEVKRIKINFNGFDL